MVQRTRGTRGHYEIDVVLKGYGRFRMTSDTSRVSTLRRRKALARLLGELGQEEVLRALKGHAITWPELERAQRQQRLADGSLLAEILLRRPLGQAIAETLPKMGPTEVTRERYRVALDGLWRVGLDPAMPVAGLERSDWAELLATWPVAAATKNNVRTAVSRFLSRYLGGKHHPFRHRVLHEDRWRLLKVPRRVRGFPAGQFWDLMQRVPEHLVPSYVILAASGMRVGEYLNDAALTVDPAHGVLYVVGKTGPKTYAIDPAAWAYVPQAVPCRAAQMRRQPKRIQNDPRYRVLRKAIQRAGKAIGLQVTLHDLRRLYVRVGVAAEGTAATQFAVGHETPGMTLEYAREDSQAAVSLAVSRELGLAERARLMSGEKSGESDAAQAG